MENSKPDQIAVLLDTAMLVTDKSAPEEHRRSGTLDNHPLQSVALPEADLRPQNRRALALLAAWMDEPDDLGDEWWDAFEQDVQQRRLSLNPPKQTSVRPCTARPSSPK
jgi:hypothetical protein